MEYCDINGTENYTVIEEEEGRSAERRLYKEIYHIFYHFGLPAVCTFGFFGNVINLAVLNQKRLQSSLMKMEQAASIYLIALALSDMLFCITAFPSTFIPEANSYRQAGFLLYYHQTCAAIISIFIMTSTWITVIFAIERYVAICHPLKSRYLLSMRGTRYTIASIYLLSAIFNIPLFWRFTIQVQHCNNATTYTVRMVVIMSTTFDHVYRGLWAIIGNIIPLVVLIYANICLIRQIQWSNRLRRKFSTNSTRSRGAPHHHSHKESNNKITVTLISIVILFLILVAPSELLKLIVFLVDKDNALQDSFYYMAIEVITNFMQSLNFSTNFILYCIINRSFRKTMKYMFCKFIKKYISRHFEYQLSDATHTHQVQTHHSVNLNHSHCGSVHRYENIQNGKCHYPPKAYKAIYISKSRSSSSSGSGSNRERDGNIVAV